MLRTIIWFTYFWLYMIVSAPLLLWLSMQSMETQHKITSGAAIKWARRLLGIAGAKVVVKGAVNLPKDAPVLFVSNHQGAFDIPLLIAHLDRPFGFIAKEELTKLPLVNRWMRYLKCVFIKRGNPREAIKAINDGITLLKSGHSLMVFPEGTRSKDGQLLEFKAGSLKLATKSSTAVVPVTIDGSRHLMKAGKWIIQPAQVTITLHDVIPSDVVATLDTAALNSQIETSIRSALTTIIN